ncbi:MAG TPA: hypothetical protein VFS94_02585 [Gemmatimonadales bacterium]|nr:hypothetical protein [Gemmatimonadales bacterium]
MRHLRLLTLLLLIGTPGLAGTALSAIHPCAADMPWTATPADHGSHHGSHDSVPSDDGAPAPCQCIGAVQGAAPMAAAGAAELAITPVAALVPVSLLAPSYELPAVPPHLLPPKTAPPTLG